MLKSEWVRQSSEEKELLLGSVFLDPEIERCPWTTPLPGMLFYVDSTPIRVRGSDGSPSVAEPEDVLKLNEAYKAGCKTRLSYIDPATIGCLAGLVRNPPLAEIRDSVERHRKRHLHLVQHPFEGPLDTESFDLWRPFCEGVCNAYMYDPS